MAFVSNVRLPAFDELRTEMASGKFDTGVPSLLSSGLRIIGTIVSDGEIQLDGSVEGDVYCTSLVIGQDARVKGDVVARNVIVRGQVEGVIRAREVQLPTSARVDGGIVSRLISVEMGAMLNGCCQYSEDPLSDEPAALAPAAPVARPVPPPLKDYDTDPLPPPAVEAPAGSSAVATPAALASVESVKSESLPAWLRSPKIEPLATERTPADADAGESSAPATDAKDEAGN